MMSGMEITERRVLKSVQKVIDADGKTKEYVRYTLTLPKEFVEKHNIDSLFLVADEVWFGLPDERKLMKILPLIPELRRLLGKQTLTEEEIQQLFQDYPELKEYVKRGSVALPEAIKEEQK